MLLGMSLEDERPHVLPCYLHGSSRLGLVAAAALSFGCSQSAPVHTKDAVATGTTQVMMSFDRSADFYSAPFPSDELRADGGVDLSAFPNPNAAPLMTEAIGLASQTSAFGASAGVFFETTAAVDPTSLPDLAGSTQRGASAFIVGIDPTKPDYLKQYPVHAVFAPDATTSGPFGTTNMLSLVPLQGYPLGAATAYAAVVTTAVKDMTGAPLVASPVVATIAARTAPSGMSAAAMPTYAAALAALTKLGIGPAQIAGLAAFTTQDPTAQTAAFRKAILALPLPAPDAPFVQTAVFDEYCVYMSTLKMPDYQAGTPPFASAGGGWAVDSSGNPAVQRYEEAQIYVTVPRQTIPSAGFPVALFVRTGAGGTVPITDRGTQGTADGPPLVPGTGPALFFARAGFAGVSIDGPLDGLRDDGNTDEDYTIFNIGNPLALRDNIRESAIELSLQAHILRTLSFDVSECPGARTEYGFAEMSFDVSHFPIMGHSMGATILPLAAALEPAFTSVILSGAGSSWIENVLYKEQPLNVKPALEFLLQYDVAHGQFMTENDPALSLFQWAIESADPQMYDYRIINDPVAGAVPRPVLMIQGIVDHYILPDIANATTLTLGLDLAGAELDQSSQEPAGQTLVSTLLPLIGRSNLSYPVSNNLQTPGGAVTGVLVQAPGDGILDGHEVVFQTDGPKHQYQCFLESTLAGTPTVEAPASVDAGCL
jgi:hypothetical protein